MSLRPLLPALAALAFCLGGSAAQAFDALGPGAIVASVRDRDGRPLAGALVTALGPGERHATTTIAGIVSLVALPLGTYRVRVVRTGYEAAETSITLVAAHGFGTLDLRMSRSNQGTGPVSLSDTALVHPVGPGDPSLAHALVALPNVDLPGGVYGAAPYESKVTLDGIPLGGPSSGAAAFRPDALPISNIVVLPGPDALAPTLEGVVGGDIDLRTQPAVHARDAQASAGYDSTFGSFQQFDAGEWSGPVSASLSAVTGGGLERDRVLRTAYALSGTTSVGFDSYNFDRNAALDAPSPLAAVSEPAYSANLSTRAFGGALDLRSYGSDYAAPTAAERLRALAGAYERKLGAGTLGFSFARTADNIGTQYAQTGLRRPAVSDLNGVASGSALRQTTAVTGQTGFKLGQTGSLDLADTWSTGSALASRQDPHAALSLPLTGAWTLRANAGSSYVSAPFELVAANPSAAALAPETAFGYRAGADLALAAGSTLSLGTFGLTRWNRFATLASARSQGVDVDYVRAAPIGFGFNIGVGLAHDIAFGPPQPSNRVLQSVPLTGGAIDDVADTRARFGFTYQTAKGLALSATALTLGPNNGITNGSLRYADFGASVPLFHYFQLRVDGATPLGTVVAPRTLSLSFGAAAGR